MCALHGFNMCLYILFKAKCNGWSSIPPVKLGSFGCESTIHQIHQWPGGIIVICQPQLEYDDMAAAVQADFCLKSAFSNGSFRVTLLDIPPEVAPRSEVYLGYPMKFGKSTSSKWAIASIANCESLPLHQISPEIYIWWHPQSQSSVNVGWRLNLGSLFPGEISACLVNSH